MYEVAWQEITKTGSIVSKRKSFKTAEAREKFIDRLAEKDSFYRVLAISD